MRTKTKTKSKSTLKPNHVMTQKVETNKTPLTGEDYLYIGNYFREMEEEYDMMQDYYKLGAKLGNAECYFNLGLFYEDIGEYDRMETCYKKAAKRGLMDALNNLGIHYKEMDMYYAAERCLKKAIKKDNVKSMYNLGRLYWEIDDYDEMKKYYYMAGEKGCVKSLRELGIYFHDYENDYTRGQTYLSWAVTAEIFGKKVDRQERTDYIPNEDLSSRLYSEDMDSDVYESYDLDSDDFDDDDDEECDCIYCHFHNP